MKMGFEISKIYGRSSHFLCKLMVIKRTDMQISLLNTKQRIFSDFKILF